MVLGLPRLNSSVTLGKQTRLPFKSSSWRAKTKLELIHTDLCGPMQVPSLGNSLYFLLFIDDLTRMCWVYFLSNKHEAFEKFKLFRAMVEKESGNLIKVLRSDRGGEFCSHEFNTYCDRAGIKRELTIPYTPQHNGVVERKNRTVMNLTRSMLQDRDLPNFLWAEAVATAVYVINRSPTKALTNQTPVEAWTGKKPTVSHMKIIGCVAYGLIPSQLNKKLDNKSEKSIFIGYSSQSSGYRLYNPISKKITTKRDVIFLEDCKWAWGKDKGISSHEQTFVDPFPFESTFTKGTSLSIGTLPTPSESTQTSTHLVPHTPDNERTTHVPTPSQHVPSTSQVPPTTILDPTHEIDFHKRRTRPPTRFKDYYSGEGLSDDDDDDEEFISCQFCLECC